MFQLILFDLDDTLIVDEQATDQALLEVLSGIAGGVTEEASKLLARFRLDAERVLSLSGLAPYCQKIGISAYEILWCRFDGESDGERALRRWAPEFRREIWQSALRDSGIAGSGMAEELGAHFFVARRARQKNFFDTEVVLRELHKDYKLGLVTNGASCLQRQKLKDSNLSGYFSTVVVSSEVGVGKPNPAIFCQAAEEVGVGVERSVMVGNSIMRDVEGATSAGMEPIWLNRSGEPMREGTTPTIRSLRNLPALLSASVSGSAENQPADC